MTRATIQADLPAIADARPMSGLQHDRLFASVRELSMHEALRSVEPFRDLPADRLAEVAGVVKLRQVVRGEALFHLGEPSDSLFLVANGRFFVFLDLDADPVAEIGAGEPLGELAFLTGRPRTATVIAARDSEILEVSRASYDRLRACAPLLQQGLLERLAERMQTIAPAARPMARAPARTIALCRAGSAPIPDTIVQRLADTLAAFGRTETIRSNFSAEDGEALEQIVFNLERECRFVLCPVDEADGEVARRLLRHCDSVVLVGALSDDPRRSKSIAHDCESLFLKRNRSLVLWRPGGADPISGTSSWLDSHCVELHHHVVLDRPSDIERVARFLAGRALGAVFGGGGALGCGHLGLVRAFRDAGVSFDIFGGTSAGAAMALALAGGHAPEEVMDRIEEIFVRKGAMRRFTLPVFSLLDHTVFDRELSANYGDSDLADLPVNGFAVSTNLTRNCMHVHRSGPLWHAVRSSGAIPGALPPFVDEAGDMFVDGALVDNLPVSTMRELKLGPNVIAGFFEEERRGAPLRYDAVPGRERLIGDIVLRRQRKFPGLVNVLSRSMLVTSRRSLRETEIGSDCLVRLPAKDGMGILDWKLGRAQEELCYRHVSKVIEAAGGADGLIEI